MHDIRPVHNFQYGVG